MKWFEFKATLGLDDENAEAFRLALDGLGLAEFLASSGVSGLIDGVTLVQVRP